MQTSDLIQGDPPLCFEACLRRNASLFSTLMVFCPHLGQIQAICDRNAHRLVRQADTHCDLAVVLLAEYTAVLPRNANGMATLLRNPGVVYDPSHHPAMPLHLVNDPFT